MEQFDRLKLENQFCFPLYAASREVIKMYKPLLDKYNLTYTQYIAMLVMWEYEKISVKEMGQKLYLDSGTLTPVIKKLVAMGYVQKYRDQNDDRVVIVEITDKGRKLKEEILDVPNQMICKIGENIQEAIQLKEILDKLLRGIR